MPWNDAPELAGSELLHTADEVENALERMAEGITASLGDKRPLIVGVMVGGMIPAGRLLTKLDFPLEVDYIHATRYHGGVRGNELIWHASPSTPLEDRHILVVDDILDEGRTLAAILESFRRQRAHSVQSAVLVNKVHDRRHGGLAADFCGLEVEDRYVFGAGMDYRGLGRNAAGIYAISWQEQQRAKEDA